MQKVMLGVVGVLFLLSAADTKPTRATFVTNNDIQTTLKKMAKSGVTDEQMRMVDVGKSNVGVAVVYRSPKTTQNAVEHDQVTEVYYIIEGSGTLMTGGALLNPERAAPDSASVKGLTGPSVRGSSLRSAESRRVAPGDVVIIPPGVGHWFSAVDGTLKYLVVRLDTDKVLPPK